MLSEGLLILWGLLLYAVDGGVGGCECPQATVLAQFPGQLPNESCCLNYSGSSFGGVTWALFSDVRNLEVLDLSECNITHIQDAAASPAWLREVYLGRNMLRKLPEDFLANATQLRVVDLGGNFLERLPTRFLWGSVHLRVLRLDSNRLSALPGGAFLPCLERLELSGNAWDCSCTLVGRLQGRWGNDSGTLGNLSCASPAWLAGRSVQSVRTDDVCRIPPFAALFILVPLLFVLGLCWCCSRRRRRRKKKRKESGFRPTKWAPDAEASDGQHRNGSAHKWRPGQPGPGGTPQSGGRIERDVLLKNQLMLRPASDLLGSTRDLYEEVEVKLGSADSLAPPPSEDLPEYPSLEAQERSESQGEDDGADPETVSVTEVMKDSANREKAYLMQSTEYYSLVPGIELEDSDHGEYESVDHGEYESVDLS